MVRKNEHTTRGDESKTAKVKAGSVNSEKVKTVKVTTKGNVKSWEARQGREEVNKGTSKKGGLKQKEWETKKSKEIEKNRTNKEKQKE